MAITRRCWVAAAPILSACGGDDRGSLASTGGATSSTGSDGASEAPADTSEGDATGADTSGSPSTSSEWDATGMEPETGASTDDTGGVSACGDMLCALDEDATSCCEDCGVCRDGATVRMETGSPAGAPGGGLTPGGVADTHAQFLGGPFAEVVFPFTIEDEPVPDAAWFWAQQDLRLLLCQPGDDGPRLDPSTSFRRLW